MASKRGIFAMVIGIIGAISNIWFSVHGVRSFIALIEYNSQGYDKTVILFSLVYCILMVLVSLLLILGVVKNHSNLIGAWVIWYAIGVVGFTVLFFLRFFLSISLLSAFEIIISLLVVVICCGIWYPIFTLWRDMKEGKVIPLD